MSQEKAKIALSGQGVEKAGNPVLTCLPSSNNMLLSYS